MCVGVCVYACVCVCVHARVCVCMRVERGERTCVPIYACVNVR